MLRFLLVRPGATEYDRQGRIQGTLNIPLTEDGRREVATIVEGLREFTPSAIYTCPCQSAKQTADAIAADLDLRVKVLDKLQNVDQGLWQGMRVDDVKSKQPKVFRRWQEQPETICPPNGETVPHAKERVAEALQKLIRKQKPTATVVLVIPEPMATIVRHLLRHDELGDLWSATGSTGKWEVIEMGAEEKMGA